MNAHDKHPIEALSAWLDGELAPAVTDAVQRHVTGCRECAALVDDFRRLAAAQQDEKVPPVPDGLAARIATRLDADVAGGTGAVDVPPLPTEAGRQQPIWSRWRAPLAAAASVMVAAVIWVAWQAGSDQAPTQTRAAFRMSAPESPVEPQGAAEQAEEAMVGGRVGAAPDAAPPPTDPADQRAEQKLDAIGTVQVEGAAPAAPPPVDYLQRGPAEKSGDKKRDAPTAQADADEDAAHADTVGDKESTVTTEREQRFAAEPAAPDDVPLEMAKMKAKALPSTAAPAGSAEADAATPADSRETDSPARAAIDEAEAMPGSQLRKEGQVASEQRLYEEQLTLAAGEVRANAPVAVAALTRAAERDIRSLVLHLPDGAVGLTETGLVFVQAGGEACALPWREAVEDGAAAGSYRVVHDDSASFDDAERRDRAAQLSLMETAGADALLESPAPASLRVDLHELFALAEVAAASRRGNEPAGQAPAKNEAGRVGGAFFDLSASEVRVLELIGAGGPTPVADEQDAATLEQLTARLRALLQHHYDLGGTCEAVPAEVRVQQPK